MIRNEVAKKYSQAIFELAKDKNCLLELRDQLKQVIETLKEKPELKNTIFHPRVPDPDKKEVLNGVFGDSLSSILYNFLYLLLDKRRLNYLSFIYDYYTKLVYREEDILEVEVISAVSLVPELKGKLNKRLEKLFSNRQILIKEQTDSGIIGGLVIKIGDNVIDGSIRKDIDLMKDRIMRLSLSKTGV